MRVQGEGEAAWEVVLLLAELRFLVRVMLSPPSIPLWQIG
jgi:hypothetical protein